MELEDRELKDREEKTNRETEQLFYQPIIVRVKIICISLKNEK